MILRILEDLEGLAAGQAFDLCSGEFSPSLDQSRPLPRRGIGHTEGLAGRARVDPLCPHDRPANGGWPESSNEPKGLRSLRGEACPRRSKP